MRVELEVVILVPPALFPCLPGEIHQLGRGPLVDAVDSAQISDVGQAGTTCPRLHPANLRRGAEKSLRHVFDGHAPLGAQLSQTSAELALTYGRARTCHDIPTPLCPQRKRLALWWARRSGTVPQSLTVTKVYSHRHVPNHPA